MGLTLQLLDPLADLELFREAYRWRKTKKHAQPDRAPFETFASNDPRQIVVGVFNGSFVAAFLLYEWQEGGYFECHFTSKRGTPRETLIEGGRMIRDAFLQNGAVELCAWVTKRNSALKNYLAALNFSPVEEKEFCQKPFIRYHVTRPV